MLHPACVAAAAVGTTGVSMVLAPAIATTGIVGVSSLLGFGSGGIVGGTWAAATQAAIGNVVASSPFAIFTSAGMGGYGTGVIASAVQIGGGVLTAGSGVTGYIAKVCSYESPK